jgi:hypothetical protein
VREIFLTPAEQQDLRALHRNEKNSYIRDRIKAILLADKGWKIAGALPIDEGTISRHVHEHREKGKLFKESSDSESKPNTT